MSYTCIPTAYGKTWTGLSGLVKRGLDSLVKHGLDSISKTWTGLKSLQLVKHGLNYYNYYFQLAFLKLCDQAFNPPFLSFFSKPVIVFHCV